MNNIDDVTWILCKFLLSLMQIFFCRAVLHIFYFSDQAELLWLLHSNTYIHLNSQRWEWMLPPFYYHTTLLDYVLNTVILVHFHTATFHTP